MISLPRFRRILHTRPLLEIVILKTIPSLISNFEFWVVALTLLNFNIQNYNKHKCSDVKDTEVVLFVLSLAIYLYSAHTYRLNCPQTS